MNTNMYNILNSLLLEEESLRYQASSIEEDELSQSERYYQRYCADIVQTAVASLSEQWPMEAQRAEQERMEAQRAEREGGDKAEDVSAPILQPSSATYPTLVRPAEQPKDLWAATVAERIIVKADSYAKSKQQPASYAMYFFQALDDAAPQLETRLHLSSGVLKQINDYLFALSFKS